MLRPLRAWRPRHLFAAWCAYWLALVVVALAPAVLAFLRAGTGTASSKQVSLSFGDGVVSAVVKHQDAVAWSGAIHFLPLVLWIAVPPLVLWALWLAVRPPAGERVAA